MKSCVACLSKDDQLWFHEPDLYFLVLHLYIQYYNLIFQIHEYMFRFHIIISCLAVLVNMHNNSYKPKECLDAWMKLKIRCQFVWIQHNCTSVFRTWTHGYFQPYLKYTRLRFCQETESDSWLSVFHTQARAHS